MSKSITWGAIVGVALGATITFALSRGWLSLPWAQAAAREAVHGAVLEDGPAAPLPHSDPARPLRPGGERIGVAPPALSRS
ncbi:MAG: hypothetical protein K1X88_30115 [Nannocystaceae bacterium]|nr:hypothetical protein [Nannocystaceae bacterium]